MADTETGECPPGKICIPEFPSDPDRFIGSESDDTVNMGGGHDVAHGRGGNDTIEGGANADRLYGESGDDILMGQGSADKLVGGTGNDTLDGGGQDDRIYGGDGSDLIVGGDGDDVLYGDNPADADDAEGWADTFVFDDDDGQDKVFDFETGLDKIRLTSGGSFTFAYDGDHSTLRYGGSTIKFYDEIVSAADIVYA
ncbi:MAG: calcium-binding protein [Novosphingobium sp.]